MPRPRQPAYSERLKAPPTWWALAGVLVFSLFLAFDVPVGPRVSVPVLVIAATLCVSGLLRLTVRIQVDPDGIRVGRAWLPAWAMGAITALDRAAAHRLRGQDVDPRAFDVLRPWVGPAVRIEVRDPQDPTPYWLVSTRRPDRLAESLRRVRGDAAGRADDHGGSDDPVTGAD